MRTMFFIVFFGVASAVWAADDAACIPPSPSPERSMTVAEMQRKIAEQERQIQQLECEQLRRTSFDDCLANFTECLKTNLKCREQIIAEKRKKYPEMYANPGRWRGRRR